MESLEKKTKAELISIIHDLEKRELENPTGSDAETKIGKLLEIIEISCKDHCPHHRQEEACRNCEIKKRLDVIKD